MEKLEGFNLLPEFEETKADTMSVESVESGEQGEEELTTELEVEGEKIEANMPPELVDFTMRHLGSAGEGDDDELPQIINEAFDPERAPGNRYSKDSKPGLVAGALVMSLLTGAGSMYSQDVQAGDVKFFRELGHMAKHAAHDLAHVSQDSYNATYPEYAHPLREGNYKQRYASPRYRYNSGYGYRQNIPQEVREHARYVGRVNEINRKVAYGEATTKQGNELRYKTDTQKFKLMGGKVYARYAHPSYRY